jgi:methionine-rich copper-binding protein CopC
MRRLASALLALGLLVALPTTSFAHDVLERTNPADGTSVTRLPATVVLSFSEEPLPIGTQVVVTGPTGPVSSGSPTIEGREVTQALSPNAPGGDYTVSYRVTSDDGHPVTGTFSFHAGVGLDGSTATAPSTVQAKAAAADDGDPSSDSGSPLLPILLTIVGTVVLLTVVGRLVLGSRETDRS